MPDAFALAAAAIFADANMSVAAIYHTPGQGEGVPLRIIRRQSDENVSELGQRLRSQADQIDVLAADLTPVKGGTFELPDGVLLQIIESPMADALGLTWSCRCRRGVPNV